jgi:hypothetical protein
MKQIFFSVFVITIFFNSCKSKVEPAYVNPVSLSNVGAVPSTFKYNMLLEAFTGEPYTSAINGNDTLNNLQTEYGNKLNIVTIHQGDFLELAYYNQFKNILGSVGGFPRACINRLPAISGSQINEVSLSTYEWRTQLDNIKNNAAQLGMAMTCYEGDNSMNVNIFVGFNTPITDSAYLTMYLVEDSITAQNQLNAPLNYKHNYVLRKVLTNGLGEYIILTNSAKYLQKEYRNIDINGYNKTNLRVLAFVHYIGATNKLHKVYNSIEASMNQTIPWN